MERIVFKKKFSVQIDLECDRERLEKNLNFLLEQAKSGTNLLYINTHRQLMALLERTLESKVNEVEGTIHIENFKPIDGWECTITLSTLDQPHLTSD